MIVGAHIIIYSRDAEADRAFFRDVLKYDSVDAGHGCAHDAQAMHIKPVSQLAAN